MSVELVTGYAGTAHVTAAQDGRRNVGTFGSGRFVLHTGQEFAITVDSANQVTVGTGDGIMDGRHVTNETAESLTIQSGGQGVSRNDLVCIRYTRNASTGVESARLVVIKGTATGGTPSDPSYNSGSIIEGAVTVDWPLWRIPVSGISVGAPERLFSIVPSISGIQDRLRSGILDRSAINIACANNQVWLVTMCEGANVLVILVHVYANTVHKTVLHGTEVATSGSLWAVAPGSDGDLFGIYSQKRISLYTATRLA